MPAARKLSADPKSEAARETKGAGTYLGARPSRAEKRKGVVRLSWRNPVLFRKRRGRRTSLRRIPLYRPLRNDSSSAAPLTNAPACRPGLVGEARLFYRELYGRLPARTGGAGIVVRDRFAFNGTLGARSRRRASSPIVAAAFIPL